MNGTSSTTYYYVKNILGDVLGITDSNGTLVAEYRYDAYGKPVKILDGNGNDVSTNYAHIANINPIRYRGYYYDIETGFYYLNSRYYDPEIGRFINADSQINASLGVLGYNMFAYCLNNPVNKVDYDGNKPGDLFDTMDEAAKDFAEYINEKSINENCEYGSFIYEKTVWETQTITYYIPNLFGNSFLSSLWSYIFHGGLTKTVKTRVKVTKYSYVEPKKGASDNVIIPMIGFAVKSKVALLHTHAAYNPKYSNDIFSSTDKDFAKFMNKPFYVATPLGTLRKYNPADGSDIILFTDIPYDSNHPSR